MESRKKQSMLRRFWRKISGQHVPHTQGNGDAIQIYPHKTQRPILPTIVHTASFSSSTSSRHNYPVSLEDEKTRRRASVPITQLGTFRDEQGADHGNTPRLGSGPTNSSTVTMVNDATNLVEEPPRLGSKRPAKVPLSNRRRTFDMGDSLNRTITMTNGFYNTSHDKGRVKVEIHEPVAEYPSSSPQLAGRTPLHLIGTKKKKKNAFKTVRDERNPPVLKAETEKEVFVLESSFKSPSPFFAPDPVKLEIARVDYHLHLPTHVDSRDVGLPETPVSSTAELKKEGRQPARRIMLEPSGPPPPVSLPPTPLKGRLRLDFASPSRSPSRIPIATQRRYFSFAASPKHISPIKAEANRRRSDL